MVCPQEKATEENSAESDCKMNDMYTLYLTDKYAPNGQDWVVGKVIQTSSFGVTMEDSRGNRHVYPSHSIEKMSQRNGW